MLFHWRPAYKNKAKGHLEDALESSFKPCTQTSSLMYAFTFRALNSTRFLRPIAKLIHKERKDHVEDTKQMKRIRNDLWNLPGSQSS